MDHALGVLRAALAERELARRVLQYLPEAHPDLGLEANVTTRVRDRGGG